VRSVVELRGLVLGEMAGYLVDKGYLFLQHLLIIEINAFSIPILCP
jgi:hypothetical protein